jgi:cyanophycinase
MLITGNFSNQAGSRGYLVLIGGAEDKKGDKIILSRIVKLNNAKNAVVIPTASNYPKGLAEDYERAFRELGVENISILDIREKLEAENLEYIAKVEAADLIFFTGGDQLRLVNILSETTLIAAIREKYRNGATVAGTSAGAAASCDPMIFDGDSESLKKGNIRYGTGFGFIKNITIDTHFVNRGRLGRLTQFLCSGNCYKGIGLGENTALILNGDDIFEVIGSEMITVVNTSDVSFSNYKDIKDNDPIVINDIKIGFLQSGSYFDINQWKVVRYQASTSEHSKKMFFCN